MKLTGIMLALAGLFGAPLLGAYMAGLHLKTILVFPPMTTQLTFEKAPFSWVAFFVMLLLVMMVMLPFIIQVIRSQKASMPVKIKKQPLPWWGWLGLAIMLLGWLLAWSRFQWFEHLQTYTFTPPWLGFILLVNGLTYRRSGRSLLTNRPWWMISLFLFSALFWWYFEYLNLLVENWFYVNTGNLTPWQFFWYATLPFSTVLPSVISTFELLKTFPGITAGLENFLPLRLERKNTFPYIFYSAGVAGMVTINFWPDYLYPLLWLAPTAILASAMALDGNTELFDQLPAGNWSTIFTLALAALICGFFWELWNYHSFTKWVYSVPLVNRFHLFEMPLLGYAGYLPFGLQCGLAAILLKYAKAKKSVV